MLTLESAAQARTLMTGPLPQLQTVSVGLMFVRERAFVAHMCDGHTAPVANWVSGLMLLARACIARCVRLKARCSSFKLG